MGKVEVEKRLQLLEEMIREVKERMPAHSMKPSIMHELFELEDEKEILTRKLQQLTG